MTALRPGSFVDYLYAEEPQTMAKLQNKLASFIRIDEGRAFQRGQREEVVPVVKLGWERRGERRAIGREEGGSEQRSTDLLRVLQYVHYTPLNAPKAKVMEEALRADLLTVTRSLTP